MRPCFPKSGVVLDNESNGYRKECSSNQELQLCKFFSKKIDRGKNSY